MIRKVSLDDVPQIAAIYNYYIENTAITFETEKLTDDEMRRRIAAIAADNPYFVEDVDGIIIGYSYFHRWKEREAYKHSVETSVYVHPDHHHHGTGRKLMHALIDAAKDYDVHCMIACVTCPNEPSENLHHELGFKQVSLFKEVGKKFGQWLDVYDFELIL